jgi:hypothetical protein
MITYKIFEEEEIVIIEPSNPIRQSDFEALRKDIDCYVRQKGMLRGLIVQIESFPRWDNLGAFIKDMKFVLDYHNKIKRVASVTDSKLFMIAHRIMRYLLFPEIKHFYYGDIAAAKKWIREVR